MIENLTGQLGEVPILTKVTLPPVGKRLVRRIRLESISGQVAANLVTLVRGPAGYGKTTIARTWADIFSAADCLIAWYSADGSDDEPSRLLFYIVHALAHALPGQHDELLRFAEYVRGSNIPPNISPIINAIVEAGDEVFLFIDDFHCFIQRETSDIFSELLRYAPANLHLIVITRTPVTFNTNKLRLNRQLLEIEAAAFVFSAEETRTLLLEQGVRLSDQESRTVLHQTGGWPAALRIASLSLSQADPQVRSVDLNLVKKLCMPLAQVLTGHRKLKPIVEQLVQQNILAPLDSQWQWFSYHALWRNYLCKHVNEDTARNLHAQASDWYFASGMLSLAVEHALEAGKIGNALQWIEDFAMSLVKKGDLFTLRDWERIIRLYGAPQPAKLKLALAWGWVLSMANEKARALVREVEIALVHDEKTDDHEMRWELRMVKSVIEVMDDDFDAALADASRCMQDTSERDLWLVNGLINVLRLIHLQQGNWADYYSLSNIPYAAEHETANAFTEIYRYCLLGLGELVQAHLSNAERYLVKVNEIGSQGGAVGNGTEALAAGLLARIYYERGQIDQARELLNCHLDMIDVVGFPDCLLNSYVTAARISWLTGDSNETWSKLEHAESIAARRGWHRITAGILSEKLRLALLQGHIGEAQGIQLRIRSLATKHGMRNSGPIVGLQSYAEISAALLALRSGNSAQAVALLGPLYQNSRERCSYLNVVHIGTLLSIAHMLEGKSEVAICKFAEVLEIAAAENIERSILDQEPGVRQLIALFLSRNVLISCSGQANRFASQLKSRLDGPTTSGLLLDAAAQKSASMEELTPQEVKVLKELASGKSNKEIARAVGRAPETVKFHLKNIFTKLSVERRTQAIRRAQLLGLLE
ncbi:MAG: LuxR C-terminal-related transcriptional regulator [Proteobacteria bacterium]|nr:LuxR C-terminal-related transcriptional regulator [Pseudomonadota bacterium]